jgi:hypothetical protein
LAAIVIAFAVVGCGSASGGIDAAAADGTRVPDASSSDGARDAAADLAAPGDAGGDGDVAGPTSDSGDGDRPTNDAGDVADRPVSPDAADDVADDASPSDGSLNARYVFKIPVLGEQMVGDALRRRLYVSVGGASPQYPNTLLTIDANTGTILATPSVGSNPRSLAISDDSSVLWVGIDGALALRRVTLTSDPPAIGPQTTLTQAFGAGQTIGPMAVLPGAPLSIVASTPDGRKTAAFDDGVARSTTASTLGRSASQLAAGAAGYVYGYDGQSTGFGLLTMAVSASGVADLSTTGGLISGFGNQIVYRAGRLYSANGEVVDVSVPTHPITAGRLPYRGPIAFGPRNLLFVLSGDTPDAGTTRPTQFVVIDGTTLKMVTTIPFPPDLLGTVNDDPITPGFVYVGPDTLAILIRLTSTTSGQTTGTVVVIRDPLIAAVN